MKTRYKILATVSFLAMLSLLVPAYGLWIPETHEGLLDQSQTVFVGTITSVKVLEFQRSNTYQVEENGVSRIIIENYTQPLDQYTVNIEEFLKNPQEFHTITMLEATVSGPPGSGALIGGFELGDRVLFYVPKLDGTNQYSPESFKIPKFCNARDTISQKRLQMGEDFTVTEDGIKVDFGNFIFTANKPIEFVFSKDMRTLEGKSLDVSVGIFKTGKNFSSVLNQEIHVKSKSCEWISSASWGFTPKQGNYNMNLSITQDNSTIYEYTQFSVRSDIPNYLLPPLKQFKSGIPIEKIQCKEGLVVIKKYDDSPVCVKPKTVTKLAERGFYRPVKLQSDSSITKNIEPFVEKYDAVIEGSISNCIGQKIYPVRSQCEIQVDSYIKFNGSRTDQFTALVYNATLVPEWNTKSVFGLKYHPNENYYEIISSGIPKNEK